MRALIQRVANASVEVGGECVGRIERGLLVFLGVQRGDTSERADAMAARLLAYRVFDDADGRMNLDVRAVRGGLLVVSQFTLAADTRKGLRPGFSEAAEPSLAKSLYDRILANLRAAHAPVASGIFAADMRVGLVNDGPVTFLLET
jgi:D-aminoacyl-tRNA deacylase